MEDIFRRVVEHIFNNWTALQLAVEHGMGGSDGNKVAVEFINYIVQYSLYEADVTVDSIQEALDDIMDQEFETVCEDGSTREIAIILNKFLCLLKDDNMSEFENEYNKLPTSCGWLVSSQSPNQVQKNCVQQGKDGTSSNTDTPMEEDSEWTEVKSRRRH